MEVTLETDALTKAELLRSGDNSDLILYCGGHAFRLHLSTVRPQSLVLGDIENSDLEWLNKVPVELTGIKQTSKPFEVYLRREDPSVVKAVADYLYRGDYDDSPAGAPAAGDHPNAGLYPSLDNTWDPRLYFSSRVYCFAKRYKVLGLPEFALEKFLSVRGQRIERPGYGLAARYLPSEEFLHDVLDVCWPFKSLEYVMSEEEIKFDAYLKKIVFHIRDLKRFEECHTELSCDLGGGDSASNRIMREMPEILRKAAERGVALRKRIHAYEATLPA
ncbi:NFX1-type zinc finger-containing 1 protein [Rutstroemia sp. NJR-2017a WRK4]|nr:NFX1-type zinc finger-containing 1 protein [Rutstroemia sp. NJR-2017a WRK4]